MKQNLFTKFINYKATKPYVWHWQMELVYKIHFIDKYREKRDCN